MILLYTQLDLTIVGHIGFIKNTRDMLNRNILDSARKQLETNQIQKYKENKSNRYSITNNTAGTNRFRCENIVVQVFSTLFFVVHNP